MKSIKVFQALALAKQRTLLKTLVFQRNNLCKRNQYQTKRITSPQKATRQLRLSLPSYSKLSDPHQLKWFHGRQATVIEVKTATRQNNPILHTKNIIIIINQYLINSTILLHIYYMVNFFNLFFQLLSPYEKIQFLIISLPDIESQPILSLKI